MDIKDTNTLVSTIEAIAPYNVGWALTDRVGDINNLASARLRTLSYKEFDIPKKSGGTRRISAPVGKLKDVLKCLSVILAPYYEPCECVHGFTKFFVCSTLLQCNSISNPSTKASCTMTIISGGDLYFSCHDTTFLI